MRVGSIASNTLGNNIMAEPLHDSIIQLGSGMRLQWEGARARMVLLYPQGMEHLNATSSDILSLCEQPIKFSALAEQLQAKYNITHVSKFESELKSFVEAAKAKGWLEVYHS